MDDAAPSGDVTLPVQPMPVPESGAPAEPRTGMLGMVLPRAGDDIHMARAIARHVLGEIAVWAVVVLMLVLLLAPATVFLVAGCWAIVTYITSAATLYQLLMSWRIADMLGPLRALDMAGRVAATSAGFYALICGLLVLVAGMLGKRWRRLFLVPGIILTVPGALAFFFALRLTIDAISAGNPISPVAQTGLTIYLLLDAVAVAAFLVDLRPKPRRASPRRQRRRVKREKREGGDGDAQAEEPGQAEPGNEAAPAVLPLVHFGPPSVPLASEVVEADTTILPAVVEAGTTFVPAVVETETAILPAVVAPDDPPVITEPAPLMPSGQPAVEQPEVGTTPLS